jgi:antitoxin (DNA-binding transcriptional repressor) of toxin-antitoxin stability system
MVKNMVMERANILDVKSRLSEYVERAARGERIVICRHNKPVAELRALAPARTTPRPTGPLPGRPSFDVPESFFEPMAEEELALWDGGGSADGPPSPFGPRAAAGGAGMVHQSAPRTSRRGRRTR